MEYLRALQRICGVGGRMQRVGGGEAIASVSELHAALVNATQTRRWLHSKARCGPRQGREAGGAAATKGVPIELSETGHSACGASL